MVLLFFFTYTQEEPPAVRTPELLRTQHGDMFETCIRSRLFHFVGHGSLRSVYDPIPQSPGGRSLSATFALKTNGDESFAS